MSLFHVDLTTTLFGGIDHGLSIVSHAATSMWGQSPAIVLIGGVLLLLGASVGSGVRE